MNDKVLIRLAGMIALATLGACSATGEDVGFDSHPLTAMNQQIWLDPNGCEHWFIDDGVEGYLVARRGRDGRPICPGPVSAGAVAQAERVEMAASIWRDPNGCHHWMVDQGLRGFLSERLDRDGRPVCD